jgi:hypothetical protein
MSNAESEPLFKLIKALSKAEKRHFKLQSAKEDALFVQLFDVLEGLKAYDERLILQKAPDIKPQQLSNLKRHLYTQILGSLRSQDVAKNVDLQIREQIDFARILYNKGLYLQSLKALGKARETARTAHQTVLLLEIVEFEKTIELRHITRSSGNRAQQLAEASLQSLQTVTMAGKLSSMALLLYGFYIKIGHVGNEREVQELETLFRDNWPAPDYRRLSFFEKINYCKSKVWYHYIRQDFRFCFKYARQWVDLYEEAPEMKNIDPDLYMRGLHNLLMAFFYTVQYRRFCPYLDKLEAYIAAEAAHFNTNSAVQGFLYLYTARLHKHYMEGSFTQGLALVPELEAGLERYGAYLDRHRILVFYYKIACLYFGSGRMGEAIDYLNKIIRFKAGLLRGDIQCYARILHLIAHYELKHYSLLEYLAQSVYRFLTKMENLNGVQLEILRFLRDNLHATPYVLNYAFRRLHTRLSELQRDPYEGRSFLYLDVISWLESKIERRKSAEVVIAEKFRKKTNKRL